MNVEDNAQISLVALDSMDGLSMGIKYFDDDFVVYVSPQIHDSFVRKTLPSLDFVTLKYRRLEKNIEEVVQEIINEIQKCPDGKVSNSKMNEMHKVHHEHQVSIDVQDSAGQGLPIPPAQG